MNYKKLKAMNHKIIWKLACHIVYKYSVELRNMTDGEFVEKYIIVYEMYRRKFGSDEQLLPHTVYHTENNMIKV